MLYLTRYTISQDRDQVGVVTTTAGQIKFVTLSGAHAQAFKVDKNHQLIVRRDKLDKALTVFDVTLTVATSAGQFTETVSLVKDDFIRNKVVAHRGAWKNTGATENSIAALNHAVALGCEGSEFDVHMSADSLPVIHHDPSIQGVSIAKTTSDVLLALKLSNGETLPTLENYLKAGQQQNKTRLILEIKASELGKESSIALTRKIMSIVERLRAQGWVDYISFDYDVCLEVMKLAPYAHVQYLTGDKTPAELVAAKFSGLDYHFSIYQKNPDWIRDALSKKLIVNVWTVNDKTLMENLLALHVDLITTNEPELLLSLIKAK
ncbi:glycerophosphodiester phosphodiesterase [Chryseolinea sp. Jin1]|uniref:Glycerophosphodiester phosphodiesterase n=2 Tax=Chryseolinea lacunae TaxID=2801331 RepID=A0ABS1KNG8_9BACT|nr:glycerophosphodiester phosphodiesterase [Chryseolinea lacunae]